MIKLITMFSRNHVFAITILFAVTFNVSGQADSSKVLKNTIRVNITNPLLFGSDFRIVGYERVITQNQTASIGLGMIGFPSLLGVNLDSIAIIGQSKTGGFNISLDYRFYPKKENKYGAPRGIYFGPYYGYNRCSRELTWDLNTVGYSGEAKTSTVITANLVGAQLGYQFVFWNRLSVDIILMGPGLWFFSLRSDFENTMPQEDETTLLEKLNEILQDKFPGSDFVFKGGGFEAKRHTTTSTMGFRYMINLGFRF